MQRASEREQSDSEQEGRESKRVKDKENGNTIITTRVITVDGESSGRFIAPHEVAPQLSQHGS